MDAFLVSTGIVAVAEFGDKTQLLAMMLAARFRCPLPVILGILVATIANHAGAALLGSLVADWLHGDMLKMAVGISFLAMTPWLLIPDKADDGTEMPSRMGPFLTTLVVFFLVEIGDKTQIATIALAARFQSLVWVTAGTTLGIMLVNVPVVLLGGAVGNRVSMTWMRRIAAAGFAALGVATLADAFHLINLL